MPASYKDTQEITHLNWFICFLGCQVWGLPGPSPQQSPADISPAWGPRHEGCGQGTHRNSGVQGEAILRVRGPHPLLGTEDMVTLGRIFLERDLGQDRNLRCWGSPRNTLDAPLGRWKTNSASHDPGGASHGSRIPQALGDEGLFQIGCLWDLLETKCVQHKSCSPQAPSL